MLPPSIGKWVPGLAVNRKVFFDKWPKLAPVEIPEGLFTVEQVNQWVNDNIEYEEEIQEYWKSPQETLDDGRGDCEDVAILKHQMLNQLGFISWVAIVWDLTKYDLSDPDRVKNAAHAVCLTPFYILDNHPNWLIRIDNETIYKPFAVMDETQCWVYGTRSENA